MILRGSIFWVFQFISHMCVSLVILLMASSAVFFSYIWRPDALWYLFSISFTYCIEIRLLMVSVRSSAYPITLGASLVGLGEAIMLLLFWITLINGLRAIINRAKLKGSL